MLLAQIAETNRAGPVPPGTVGAVVGATLQPSTFPLPELGGVILAPGVGAQGAGPAEVARLFAGCPPGSVLASVSRSVLSAGPDVGAMAAAARRTRDEIAAVLA
jgi:orotidine-5'-phosphate decarboxylase